MTANEQPVLLQARALTRESHGFRAVSQVDPPVVKGTVHALVEPNDARKTTLFNVLFQPPTSASPCLGPALSVDQG